MLVPVRYVLLYFMPSLCYHSYNIQEYSLEKAMQKMVDDWEPIVFNTTLYRDTGKGLFYFTGDFYDALMF